MNILHDYIIDRSEKHDCIPTDILINDIAWNTNDYYFDLTIEADSKIIFCLSNNRKEMEFVSFEEVFDPADDIELNKVLTRIFNRIKETK